MIQRMEKTVSRNRKIALTGALCALVVVLGMPPLHLGMIPLGPNASITIMHIPVLLAVMLSGGASALASGIVVGTVFGVFSLILAAITPPRALLAAAAWLLWRLLSLIPHLPKTVSAALAAFISTLAHTCFVVGALYIFAGGRMMRAMGGKGFIAVLLLLLPNALLEAAAAAIVCAAVIASVTVAAGKKSKLSQEDKN